MQLFHGQVERIFPVLDHLCHDTGRQALYGSLHQLITSLHLRDGFCRDRLLIVRKNPDSALIGLCRLQAQILQNIIHIPECLAHRITKITPHLCAHRLITLIRFGKGSCQGLPLPVQLSNPRFRNIWNPPQHDGWHFG